MLDISSLTISKLNPHFHYQIFIHGHWTVRHFQLEHKANKLLNYGTHSQVDWNLWTSSICLHVCFASRYDFLVLLRNMTHVAVQSFCCVPLILVYEDIVSYYMVPTRITEAEIQYAYLLNKPWSSRWSIDSNLEEKQSHRLIFFEKEYFGTFHFL